MVSSSHSGGRGAGGDVASVFVHCTLSLQERSIPFEVNISDSGREVPLDVIEAVVIPERSATKGSAGASWDVSPSGALDLLESILVATDSRDGPKRVSHVAAAKAKTISSAGNIREIVAHIHATMDFVMEGGAKLRATPCSFLCRAKIEVNGGGNLNSVQELCLVCPNEYAANLNCDLVWGENVSIGHIKCLCTTSPSVQVPLESPFPLKAFYPFLQIPYRPLMSSRKEKGSCGLSSFMPTKLYHIIVLWGSLIDQSC